MVRGKDSRLSSTVAPNQVTPSHHISFHPISTSFKASRKGCNSKSRPDSCPPNAETHIFQNKPKHVFEKSFPKKAWELLLTFDSMQTIFEIPKKLQQLISRKFINSNHQRSTSNGRIGFVYRHFSSYVPESIKSFFVGMVIPPLNRESLQMSI